MRPYFTSRLAPPKPEAGFHVGDRVRAQMSWGDSRIAKIESIGTFSDGSTRYTLVGGGDFGANELTLAR